MASNLLLVVFSLRLIVYLFGAVGSTALNELLWILYNKLPTSTSKAVAEQSLLRREVLKLKKELNSVSAQDEFSKWAKLRRQHDKAVGDYDKKAESLQSSKTSFDNTISTLRFLITRGLPLILQFWYRKVPLFWIPHGWFPGYVEWFLALPGAPSGSIGIQIWGMACSAMIQLIGDAVVSLYALATGKTTEKEKPQAYGSGKGTPTGSGSATPKKEL